MHGDADRESDDPLAGFDWEDTTAVGVSRGLEELRDALTPDEADDHIVRKHRGLFVLGVVVGAFWLGVAGAFAAVTREAPLTESVIAFEPAAAAAAPAVEIGPNEWPLIAIAPREFRFSSGRTFGAKKPKKAAPPAAPLKKKALPR